MPVVDAAIGNANDVKGLLANSLSLFFIDGNSAFSNGPRNMSKTLLIVLF